MSKTLQDFKAVLFDVDLTLTDSTRHVTPRTQATLKKLADHGLKMNVCSGRHPLTLIDQIFPLFPTDSIHITCGGAKLVTGSGETLWEKMISDEICQKICAKATELELGVTVQIEKWTYVNDVAFQLNQKYDRFNKIMKPLSESPHWYPNIIVVTDIPEEFLQFLDTIPEISYKKGPSSTGKIHVDISPVGINKAVGIMEWCKITSIEPEEIIGFGDAENDFEFLQFVGYSVAMGNADEQLKALANRVIGHANEDGLAVYLEQLMEGNPV
jgi:Cof subfamily protein (haloacid dehalogenase superfamily)